MARIANVLMIAMFLAAPLAVRANAAATATAGETPEAVVQGMVTKLGADITGHKAALHGNPDRMDHVIDQVVLPNFDVGFASLLVLGSHAFSASPADRAAFQAAFRTALTHSFAKGLIDFDQVNVKVLPAQAAPSAERALVRTQVLQKGGSTVAVDYAFHRTSAGSWKIYDVIIEGISYITLYRSQVNSQIDKEGLERVIESLRTKGLIDVNQ